MTSDSSLRYLNEETQRQRVYTQSVAQWVQAPLSPDTLIIFLNTTAIDRSISFRIPSASRRFPAANWLLRPRRCLAVIHLLASWAVGPREYWLLGRRLSPGVQGQASFTPAATRRRCLTKVKPKARRESLGHGRSSKTPGLNATGQVVSSLAASGAWTAGQDVSRALASA